MPLFNRRDHAAELAAQIGSTPIVQKAVGAYWTGWRRPPALPPHIEMHHPAVYLAVTEQDVWVSWWIKNRLGELMFRIPMADVEAIFVAPWDSAQSYYEWRPTSGLLHGATHQAATSGLVFVLGETERVLFKFVGAPIELETGLAPLLALKPRPS